MKNLFLNLFIAVTVILFFLPASGQEILFNKQILYQMTFQKDSSDKSSLQMEIMELLLSDSISIFQSQKLGMKDSIESEGEKKDQSFRLNPEQIKLFRTQIKYSIYKPSGGNVLFKENFTNQPNSVSNIKYYVDQPVFDWELMQDTRSINGFTCQKAVTKFAGRTWTAWFTNEIPLNEGPYKFRGLPGLIVKISDSKDTWSFDLTQIKSIKRIVNVPEEETVKNNTLSKLEFYKQKRFYMVNETIIKEGNGLLAFRNQATRLKMIENDKKKSSLENNWIEEPKNN